ncbi:MAG TPA: ABC transporter substrate-binding protein [Burkholderiales bacterium]
MWKTLCRSILVGAALCAAAAHADEQAGVVKLGAILSLSGPAAPMGDAELKTVQLYVERINAKGGVLTRKLILRHVDDGGDPRAAAELAHRFTEHDHDKPDHADLVIGGSTTETSLAIMQVLQKAGIPFLSLGSGSRIIDPPHRLVFKTPPSERAAVRALLTDMKKRGYTRIALLAEDSEFGKEYAKELRDQTGRNSLGRKTYGVSVEIDQNYAANDNDIAQKVAGVKGAAGLHAIAVFGLGQSPALVTRKIRESGITLPLYHSHGVATDEFIRLAGKDAEGVRLPGPRMAIADLLPDADPQKPVIKAYIAAYRERYGEPPTAFGGYAYDALMLAIEAIERVETLNFEEVGRSLTLTRHHVGVTGIYEDSPSDVFSLNPATLLMLEVRGGAWRLAD